MSIIPDQRHLRGRRVAVGLALSFFLLQEVALAQEQVRLVGLGASTCAEYRSDVAAKTATEREYFAWGQGFMSGILARAPAGKDVGLNLAPSSMALIEQVEYLRSYCVANSASTYSDGVVELYKELRTRQR